MKGEKMYSFTELSTDELILVDGGIDWNGVGQVIATSSGAYIGAKVGATFGTAAGPIGTFVGGVAGGVIGHLIYTAWD